MNLYKFSPPRRSSRTAKAPSNWVKQLQGYTGSEEILTLTDKRLFMAKSRGRNRIVFDDQA